MHKHLPQGHLPQDIQKKKSRIKIPKKDIVTRTSASRTLIDTSGEKFKNSPGLQHWASVKNLKTAASYAAADNLSELQKHRDSCCYLII